MSRNIATRRAVLAGAATAASGSIGWYALSDSASASATIEESTFSIQDQQHEISNELADVRLTVNMDWSYSADTEIERRIISLFIGDSKDNIDNVDMSSIQENRKENTGTAGVEASIADASAFSLDGLVDSETTIYAKVRMRVQANGETVADDSVTESFILKIEDNSVNVTMGFDATGTTSVSEQA